MDKYKELSGMLRIAYGDKYLQLDSMPKWDIPEVLVIKAALSGAFFYKTHNPIQPYTADEILKEAFECIEAGACNVHLHIRNSEGDQDVNLEHLHVVVDQIRKKYGNKVVIDGCCQFGPDFERVVAPVTQGLYEIAPVIPSAAFIGNTVRAFPPQYVAAQAEYFREHKCKPIVAIFTAADIDNAYRWLIKPGLLDKPYYWALLFGLPGHLPMPNPIAMCEGLLFAVKRIREIDPTSVIHVDGAARASSYLTTLAILLGLHVRVGTEDTVWKYPHKDELIESNGQMVKSTIEIARQLGRRPATADEYRRLIGIKR
jgi:3-keto-5-aminohexanoate cleavage enzyme